VPERGEFMGVSYKRLWKLLIDKNIKKTKMREKVGISTSTLSKLTRDEYVSLDVLVRVCSYLKCQISDICEVIYEERKDKEEVKACKT
jgi:DNA-binding Xre family transcriptional regulator